MKLSNQIALVTGGGTGIGRGIAQRFAEEGAKVVVVGRREEPLRETSAGHAGIHGWTVDVTSEADRAELAERLTSEFGGLDILVNNAGVVTSGPLSETPESEWERLFGVNVLAPLALARTFLPTLTERKGSILNVSTGASLRPVPGYGAYGATKAALNYLSQVMALESAPDVRVNVLCPGGVDTPIFDTFLDESQRQQTLDYFAGATPLGRIGQPQDLASAAVFLSSREAEWITGSTLVVDGGLNLG